ncbi:Tas Predicted oxidoreductases (related to aryl-alcohol dehydrogenases) [actinobacterium SCGC AAA044-D11]
MARHSELTKVKGTDLEISKLSLGTAPLGGLFKSVPESEADAMIDLAISSGINYIDTAPLYGYGTGERRVGRALAGRKSGVVISTKVGRPLRPGVNLETDKYPDADPGIETYYDYSSAGIRNGLEASLKRLNLDSIEIAYLHDAQDCIQDAIEIAYPVLDAMRSEGIIKAIGIGMNWCAPSIEIIKNTDLDIALIAGRFTLLDQSAQDELYPLAMKKNVSIVAAGVYNTGVLANPVEGAQFDYVPAPKEIIDRALKIRDFLKDFNVPLTAAAMQFPLRHPAVVTVLNGAGTVAELKQNIEAFDFELPTNLWSELESAGLIQPVNI